jgi:hypothetical protein
VGVVAGKRRSIQVVPLHDHAHLALRRGKQRLQVGRNDLFLGTQAERSEPDEQGACCEGKSS